MKLTDCVNIFHGSGEIDLPAPQGVGASWCFIKGLAGNTSPAAMLPFGKYSVSPYSGGYSSGYGVNRKNCGGPVRKLGDKLRLRGFSHFHLSGIGAADIYYNYAVVKPYYGQPALDYGVDFEEGEPGYYKTRLAETGIVCELTATETCAMHRYSFSAPGGKISVDFSNDGLYADEEKLRSQPEEMRVNRAGDKTLEASGLFQGVRFYFAVSFLGDGALDSDNGFVCNRAGEVLVRFSASCVDMASARADIQASGTDFDAARVAAGRIWEEALSKIRVQSGDKTELEIFYSNLYHSLTKPSNWKTGGFLWDGGPFVCDIVTMWDIYKTQLPLLFSLYPEISEDFIAMVTRMGLERGRMPHSLLMSSQLDMEAKQARFLAVYAIYDAYKRGVKADYSAAMDAVMTELRRDAFADFVKTGTCARTTHILDMAEGCAAGAELARALGREDDAELLEDLAKNWVNAFDKSTGLLFEDREYYEGNHWNYSFRPLRNMEERISLCGGREAYVSLLDKFFGYRDANDTSARFEGFNNETDLESPYAYHYAGEHEKLCEILRTADKYFFRDKAGRSGPGGIPGNNDSGGLSSCYIWNSLGLFPVSGQDVMLLTVPKFEYASLALANGKTLEIKKQGTGLCPKSISFNGKPCEDRKISADALMSGGVFIFEM